MSKFVEALVAEGLCEVIEPSEGVLQLSKVNRAHPAFRGLVIERASDDDEDEEETEMRPLIVELYKPTVALSPLFPPGSPELHERKNLAKFLWAYTASRQLSAASGSQVKLDKLLAESLYSKNAHHEGDVVEKKELLERFIAKMQRFHQINRGTLSEVRKGEVGGVHVIVEQRQGRKHVTRVSGLEGFALNLDELCSELQKMCAASVSQQPLPTGKNNAIEVCVQGNFGEELCNHLRTKYSIPNKYIELEDKSAAKKKK
jgi:translation initiation factor 1 (eIF-1/SUI1)